MSHAPGLEVFHGRHQLIARVHDKRAVLRNRFVQRLAGDQQGAGRLVRVFGLQHHRITRVAWINRDADTEWLFVRLEEVVLRLNNEIYHYELYGLEKGLQYTIYEGAEGGHYNWHVDMGTHNPEPRKISLSLQLSAPADYEGGRLVIEAGDGAYPAETARGTIVAFPSYVLHRVSPTESGVRKSLVIWVAGPDFR